jgi:ElaB/YqjD/DUF883 family membrane-anchored ribosome-binding protein
MSANKLSEQANILAEYAAQSADLAIKSTQRVAHDALDNLHDASRQLQNKAQGASDSTVRYIKHEPVKAMLIAAATGAALMALISLLSHSRHRS